MLDSFLSLLGYTGSDPVITYIVVGLTGVLTIALAYRFIDFLFTLITSLTSRRNDIKF